MASGIRDTGVIVLAAGGALAVAFLYARGRTPSVYLDTRSVTETYDPYAHFLHQSPAGWTRHFPANVGVNCLPLITQNADIGRAVPGFEVDGASYAQ